MRAKGTPSRSTTSVPDCRIHSADGGVPSATSTSPAAKAWTGRSSQNASRSVSGPLSSCREPAARSRARGGWKEPVPLAEVLAAYEREGKVDHGIMLVELAGSGVQQSGVRVPVSVSR